MKLPKISIVTITYNSESTLEETIKSVVVQNYPNLEYIIIDGGSKDRTLSIVDKYKDYISYVVSEPDKGISDAFNKGVKAATGDMIGLINSDDLLYDGALKALSEAFDPTVDVYRGRTVIWNSALNSKLSIEPSMVFKLGHPIKAVNHQSTFITPQAYKKWGYYRENFKYMMDADILHRLYRNGAKFKKIDYDLSIFRVGGTTNDSWKKKIWENRELIIVNGGNKLVANTRVIQSFIWHYIKKFAFLIIGESRAREMRYKYLP